MKKMQRTMAVILAAATLVTAMSGCGGKKNEEQASIPVLQKGEVFVPEKDLEISVWQTMGSDFVPPKEVKNNVVEDWLVNKTRVKVVNAYGNGGGQWEAVLARLIAGDNFPELVACGGGQGAAHFSRIAQADKIWELTPEMLQMYAPDVWKKVPEAMWERIKVDGKIYGIPYLFGTNKSIDPNITDAELEVWGGQQTTVGTQLWIRDDIAKMLFPESKSHDELLAILNETNQPIGDEIMDIQINSTEDFIKLFEDIKALDLKVGNKPVYPFGYAGADLWVPLAYLGAEMMGFKGHNYTGSWNPKTKEIRIPLVEPIVKEAAAIQNRFLREEIIDPESLLHTDTQCKEKLLNGQYAVAAVGHVIHQPALNAQLAQKGASFRYRPLYTNVPQQEGYEGTRTMANWGGAIGILKAVSAEDVPQVLNWINTQFTEEYEEIRYWGPKEAGLYTDNPDGTRTFKNDKLNQIHIYHKDAKLEPEEAVDINASQVGLFSVRFRQDTKWDPMIYNNIRTYQLFPSTGGKFSLDSPYLTKKILSPPAEAWSPEYAKLESVTKYWSSRGTWEEPFKVALAAKTEEEFNQKWDAAIEHLNSIVNIDEMCKEMTEIARNIELIE